MILSSTTITYAQLVSWRIYMISPVNGSVGHCEVQLSLQDEHHWRSYFGSIYHNHSHTPSQMDNLENKQAGFRQYQTTWATWRLLELGTSRWRSNNFLHRFTSDQKKIHLEERLRQSLGGESMALLAIRLSLVVKHLWNIHVVSVSLNLKYLTYQCFRCKSGVVYIFCVVIIKQQVLRATGVPQ